MAPRALSPHLKGRRLVQQHHRDAIHDRKAEPVLRALQGLLTANTSEPPMTIGAGEYFEQLVGQWHAKMVPVPRILVFCHNAASEGVQIV